MSQHELLKVQHLNVYLSDKHILKDLDLQLESGEWLGLVGANGSGKTTLIRSLCGRLPVSPGCVTLDGVDLARDPVGVKLLLGVSLEPTILPEDLELQQFLKLWAQARCGADVSRESMELVELLNLQEALHLPIGALSLGMRQKVSLIAALMGEAKLLLLDEALSNLDPMSRSLLRDILVKRNQQGTAILYCAHEFAELERCCDRVLALEQGQFFAQWTRAEYNSGELEQSFVDALKQLRAQKVQDA